MVSGAPLVRPGIDLCRAAREGSVIGTDAEEEAVEVTVRRGCADDLSAVAVMSAMVQDSHASFMPGRFKPGAAPVLESWLRTTLGGSDTLLWVAGCQAGVVGYALVFARHEDEGAFTHARDWYFVEQIAVDPAWQRRGVARRLIAAVNEHALAAAVSEIELISWRFNDEAHEAFRRLGFAPRRVMFALRHADDDR
jgi:GNAT superfamily N-acetyltransferase